MNCEAIFRKQFRKELERIKRVDQIAELTKSIPIHDDVEKYESDGGSSYWNGYYNETSRVSDEWKQNRRDTHQSNQQRENATKALKEAIERLDQRRRSLKDLLANRGLTESARALYNTELGQIDAYEDHITAQLQDVAVSGGGGGRASAAIKRTTSKRCSRMRAAICARMFHGFSSLTTNMSAAALISKGSRPTWPPARSGWKRTAWRNPAAHDSLGATPDSDQGPTFRTWRLDRALVRWVTLSVFNPPKCDDF